jgi:murein L,D-transpeptidase YafK
LNDKTLQYKQGPPPGSRGQRSLRRFAWTIPSLVTLGALAAVWLFSGSARQSLQAAQQPSGLFSTSKNGSWNLQFDAYAPAGSSTVLPQSSTAEEMIEHVYELLRASDRSTALTQTQILLAQYPNFQLAHLILADLLNEQSTTPIDPKSIEGKETSSGLNRYDELLLESNRRLNRPQAASLQGLIPRNIVSLSPQNPYFIAVDTSKSRLYWFANKTIDPLKPQLKLLLETYVSVGQKGIGKSREGDGRTPLGVYFVNKNLKGQMLPDLYGAGALTLNYPNALDLMRGQTGSGIWLHGTPSEQFSRAPLATDGCVVLSNPDMDRLLHLKNVEKTPVLITEKLEWVSSDRVANDREAFKKALDQWVRDRQTSNLDGLKNTYSEQFQRDGKGLSSWWPEIASAAQSGAIKNTVEMQSIIEWKDAQDYMVVNVTNPNQSRFKRNQNLRMYWTKSSGNWQIVYEGPV